MSRHHTVGVLGAGPDALKREPICSATQGTFPRARPRHDAPPYSRDRLQQPLFRLKSHQLPERLSSRRPTQRLERFARRTPSVPVVLPVESGLPVVRCRGKEARHSHLHHRRVVQAPPLHRFLRKRVGILRHFGTNRDSRRETRFLMQFSLRSLGHRLSRLDAASDHMPITALHRRSMDEKNFPTVAPRHEHSDLGTRAHNLSVGNYRVRRRGTFLNTRPRQALHPRDEGISSPGSSENITESRRRPSG